MKESDYDALVTRIYDAAVDPSVWDCLLDDLRTAFDGSVAALLSWDLRSNASRVLGTRAEPANDYMANWNTRNPLRQPNTILRAGVVATDAMMMPRDSLRRTDYYNEFLGRYELNQLLALKLWNSGQEDAVLNLFRHAGQDEFDNDDIDAAKRLMPHLQGAVALSSRLVWRNAAHQGAAVVLDRLAAAMVLLNQHGGVLHVNEAGRRLDALRDGVVIGTGGISAAIGAEQSRLSRLIGLAARGDAHAKRRGGAMTLSRPSGRRALAVIVAPLSLEFNWLMPSRPAAIVTIIDPEQDDAGPTETLRALYDLTRSESAVALGIAAGHELKDVADRLGLTIYSTRQYLSRVFRKTQTSRQHELTRLLVAIGLAPG